MDEDTALREKVEAQQGVIARQGELIERLEERLGRVEDAALAESRSNDGGDVATAIVERRTDRRHLLTTAATVAVGAVAGGTALALGQASPAAASPGAFDGNPAVSGHAVPDSGIGVQGDSLNGTAVEAGSPFGLAVHAVASQGTAIHAESAVTQLRLSGNLAGPLPPLSDTIARSTGSIVMDKYGDLWLCIADGNPGTWRRLSGTNTAGALRVLNAPVRAYDSRPGFPPSNVPKGKLTGYRGLTMSAGPDFTGATAVIVNLVATGTTGSNGGFLAIYRAGIPWPGTSNVNWSGPNQNVAVTTLSTVDPTGGCMLFANVATDVVVDFIGYYR